jgi:hypothetical protein
VKPPLENAVENAPGVAVEFVDPIVIVGKAAYIDEPLTWISNCKEAPVGGVPTAHTGRLVSTVALGQYGIFNRAPTVKLEVSSLRLNISSACEARLSLWSDESQLDPLQTFKISPTVSYQSSPKHKPGKYGA